MENDAASSAPPPRLLAIKALADLLRIRLSPLCVAAGVAVQTVNRWLGGTGDRYEGNVARVCRKLEGVLFPRADRVFFSLAVMRGYLEPDEIARVAKRHVFDLSTLKSPPVSGRGVAGGA